jgi:hypothetical protein
MYRDPHQMYIVELPPIAMAPAPLLAASIPAAPVAASRPVSTVTTAPTALPTAPRASTAPPPPTPAETRASAIELAKREYARLVAQGRVSVSEIAFVNCFLRELKLSRLTPQETSALSTALPHRRVWR